jgi:hypothetical protein
LGLANETALNIPDSLTYEEIGKPIDEGTTKTAYTLNTSVYKKMNKIKSKKRELSYIHCFGFLTLQINPAFIIFL